MEKILKFYMFGLLCFVVACNDVHHLDHTSGGPEHQKNQSKCFSDLDKLTTFSLPESCKNTGVSPSVVEHNTWTSKGDGIVGMSYFVSNTGRLEITCKKCDLSGSQYFGPGPITVNGHLCRKEMSKLHCPQEIYQHAGSHEEVPPEPVEPARKHWSVDDLKSKLVGVWTQGCLRLNRFHLKQGDEKMDAESVTSKFEFEQPGFWSHPKFRYEFNAYDSSDCHGFRGQYSYSGTYSIDSNGIHLVLDPEVRAEINLRKFVGQIKSSVDFLDVLEFDRNRMILGFDKAEVIWSSGKAKYVK